MSTLNITEVNSFAEKLAELILKNEKNHITIVGIITGGSYIADGLESYFNRHHVAFRRFDIKVDTTNKKIAKGEENFKFDSDTTYIFIDDAIWSANTKKIIEKEIKKFQINTVKFAVILDPNKLADYALITA
jgi:hypoxanthine phosphoribosyltransferase